MIPFSRQRLLRQAHASLDLFTSFAVNPPPRHFNWGPFSSFAQLSRQRRGCAPRLNDKPKSKQAPRRPSSSPRRPPGDKSLVGVDGKTTQSNQMKTTKEKGRRRTRRGGGDNGRLVIRWRSLCPGCSNVGAGSLFTRASVRQGCADCLCMTLNHSRRRHQTFMGTFFK